MNLFFISVPLNQNLIIHVDIFKFLSVVLLNMLMFQ